MIFHDITIQLNGDIYSRREHDSASLLPAAVAVFDRMLAIHGASFRRKIPVGGLGHIEVEFTEETCGAALATFWVRGKPVTTSALLSGIDAQADTHCLKALQALAQKMLAGTLIEPGFAMLSETDRPLLASLILAVDLTAPGVREDLGMIADMETCLAAAYFGRLING